MFLAKVVELKSIIENHCTNNSLKVKKFEAKNFIGTLVNVGKETKFFTSDVS